MREGIVKGKRHFENKKRTPFPSLLFSRKRTRIECPRMARSLPLSFSLGQRRKTSPFSRDKEQEDDEQPLKHERVEQSRKRGFGVDERSSNRANLSLSLSYSCILRASDFKATREKWGGGWWVKKGSGIEKETMSSARRRILESIFLSVSLSSGWSTSSGFPLVDARYQCIFVPFIIITTSISWPRKGFTFVNRYPSCVTNLAKKRSVYKMYISNIFNY